MVAASQVLSGDAKKQSSSLYNSYFFIVFEMVLSFLSPHLTNVR